MSGKGSMRMEEDMPSGASSRRIFTIARWDRHPGKYVLMTMTIDTYRCPSVFSHNKSAPNTRGKEKADVPFGNATGRASSTSLTHTGRAARGHMYPVLNAGAGLLLFQYPAIRFPIRAHAVGNAVRSRLSAVFTHTTH